MSSKIGNSPHQRAPWALAATLTAWYALSSFALILLATAFLHWSLSYCLAQEDDDFLSTKIRVIGQLMRDHGIDSTQVHREVEPQFAPHEYERVYVRIEDDRTGEVLMVTPRMEQHVPDLLFADADKQPVGARPDNGADVRSQEGVLFRVMSGRVPAGPDRIMRIQVAMNESSEEAVLNRYRRVMWVALAVASVVCAAVGYQIARRGVRPVKEVADTAQRIRSTTLHERIDPAGLPREIASLATTFNEMLDRLEDAFARLSSFSANIAHELRTPVHALRGEIEVALGKTRTPEEYRQVLGSCLEECAQVARLIDRLLFLARAEDPATQIARQPFDVPHELVALREFYDAAAADQGVQIRIDGADASIIAALDRTLFQRAVGNLIENAIAHTPAGGTITLSLKARDDEGIVTIEVADTGCGIAAEHLPRMFDRFHRIDGARPRNGSAGMGLGLAITKSVARLHGGDVRVTSELGVGTRVVLSFATRSPASKASPALPAR